MLSLVACFLSAISSIKAEPQTESFIPYSPLDPQQPSEYLPGIAQKAWKEEFEKAIIRDKDLRKDFYNYVDSVLNQYTKMEAQSAQDFEAIKQLSDVLQNYSATIMDKNF